LSIQYTTLRGKTYFANHACSGGYADALLACRYNDDNFEYRHVQLPKQMLKAIPKDYFDGARGTLKLLWEDEWRGLGITQVRRWHQHKTSDVLIHDIRVWGGSITRCTSRNRTSCCSSKYDLCPDLRSTTASRA
jgi:hypothetical protein